MNLANAVRLALLAAFVAAPAQAQAAGRPLLLMIPSSDWTVDHAADSCALRRAFSGGKDTASLEIRQFAPGDILEITIGSDTLRRTRGAPRIRHQAHEAWFDPGAPSFLGNGDWHGVRFNHSFRPAASRPASEAWGVRPEWPDEDRDARETAVTELMITGSFERQLALQTGAMHAPMETMRACLRELVTQWGLDSSVQETLSRRVQPLEQRTWAQQIFDAYPVDMLRQGKSGRVQIRLIVGIDGKPTSCVARKGSAEPSFETAACASAMRYARFEPALDAQGQPVASYWGSTLIYQTRR